MTASSDTPLARLKELGLSLPKAAAPVANYVPFVRAGALLFISGQLPLGANGVDPAHQGKLGAGVRSKTGSPRRVRRRSTSSPKPTPPPAICLNYARSGLAATSIARPISPRCRKSSTALPISSLRCSARTANMRALPSALRNCRSTPPLKSRRFSRFCRDQARSFMADGATDRPPRPA